MSGTELSMVTGEPEWRADEMVLADLTGTNARLSEERRVSEHTFVTPVMVPIERTVML